MSKKHKKGCTALNYIKHWFILASVVTGCVSVSAFASLVGILIGIASSPVGLKICVITVGIKNYRLITKEKVKKYEKIVLLTKTLNSYH